MAARAPNFARAYDRIERIVPGKQLGRRVSTEDAHRELLRQAGVALGVGNAADLADYWRLPVRDARPRLMELVEEGQLREVKVEGAKGVYFTDAVARALGRELHALADWISLGSVSIERKGNLAKALAAAI